MPVVWKLLQGFEAYVGWLFLRKAFVGVVSEWQVRKTAYFSSADFGYPEKGEEEAKYAMKIRSPLFSRISFDSERCRLCAGCFFWISLGSDGCWKFHKHGANITGQITV